MNNFIYIFRVSWLKNSKVIWVLKFDLWKINLVCWATWLLRHRLHKTIRKIDKPMVHHVPAQGRKKIIFSNLRTSFGGWVLHICHNLVKHLSELWKRVLHLYLKTTHPYWNPVSSCLASSRNSVHCILTFQKTFYAHLIFSKNCSLLYLYLPFNLSFRILSFGATFLLLSYPAQKLILHQRNCS